VVKIEIELTEEQDRRLTEAAAERKEPKDALVRRAIDGMFGLNAGRPRAADDPEWQAALAAIGKFTAGLSDVSARHDDYLNEDPKRGW